MFRLLKAIFRLNIKKIYIYIKQCRKINEILFTLSYLIINKILKYENVITCCIGLYFNHFTNYRSFRDKRREEVIMPSSVIMLGVNTSHTGELQLGCSANAHVISTCGREKKKHAAQCVLFIKRSWGKIAGGKDWRGMWRAWEGLQTHTQLQPKNSRKIHHLTDLTVNGLHKADIP
jgi:hypothetical protein